jgi:outer membrane protein TolC
MRRLLFLLLIPFTAFGQEPVTLQQCLQRGLENNYGIQMVRNLERVADNNASLWSAGFLPTAEVSGALTDKGESAGVDVGWTLFDGFRVQTSHRRLKELQAMGELTTRLRMEEFVAEFAAEYYSYIRQQIRLNNLRHAVQLSRERFEIVQVSEQVGTMSGYDIQQARVDLNADSSLLVRQAEVLHVLGTRLNAMMASQDIEAPIVPAESEIVYSSSLERDELLAGAMEANVGLLMARKDEVLSRLDLKVLQSRNMPLLRANGGYGYTGTPGREGEWGTNYGLTMGFTLFDGMNRRREQRNARIMMENSSLARAEAEQTVNVAMSNAWMAYRNNLTLVEVERDNLETAQLGYRLAMERYREQQLSGIELREAQTSLLDAEERLVQAAYDLKLCEITLMRIAGKVGIYLL